MKIIAFIFARSGSKGIKKKNLKNFLGEPLLVKTIRFAKKANIFHKIVLSSEDKKILSVGKKFNLHLINRPKSLALDNSPEWLSWKHAIKSINKTRIFFDLMVVLPCTSPLKIKQDLQKCIKAINSKVDVVTTIAKSNRHPSFNMVRKYKNSYIDIYFKKKIFFRRQDTKPIFNLTNSIYVTRPNYVLSRKNMFDGRVKGIEIPQERSIDIDNISDFFLQKKCLKN